VITDHESPNTSSINGNEALHQFSILERTSRKDIGPKKKKKRVYSQVHRALVLNGKASIDSRKVDSREPLDITSTTGALLEALHVKKKSRYHVSFQRLLDMDKRVHNDETHKGITLDANTSRQSLQSARQRHGRKMTPLGSHWQTTHSKRLCIDPSSSKNLARGGGDTLLEEPVDPTFDGLIVDFRYLLSTLSNALESGSLDVDFFVRMIRPKPPYRLLPSPLLHSITSCRNS
jgi:hypothetical protein